MRIWIYGMIALFWLVTTGIYVKQEVWQRVPTKSEASFLHLKKPKRVHLIIEEKNKLIGQIDSLYLPKENQTSLFYNRVSYQFEGGSIMMMPLPAVKIQTFSLVIIGKDGKPMEFLSKVKIKTGKVNSSIHIHGKKIKNKYKIQFTIGGQTYTQEKKDFPILPGNSPFSKISKIEVGKTWTRYNQLSGLTYKIRAVKKEKIMLHGENHEAYLLESKLRNSPSPPTKAWVDLEGEILRAKLPDGKVITRVFTFLSTSRSKFPLKRLVEKELEEMTEKPSKRKKQRSQIKPKKKSQPIKKEDK